MFVPADPPRAPPGDASLRLSHLKVGASADIPLELGESDLSQLAATVTAPSGRREPCQLKRLRSGHLGEGTPGDTARGAQTWQHGAGMHGGVGTQWGTWGHGEGSQGCERGHGGYTGLKGHGEGTQGRGDTATVPSLLGTESPAGPKESTASPRVPCVPLS